MMQRGALIPTKDLMDKELYLQPALNRPRTTLILPFRVKGSPDILWAWKLILDCPSFTDSRKK
jgi:hypothetical protein